MCLLQTEYKTSLQPHESFGILKRCKDPAADVDQISHTDYRVQCTEVHITCNLTIFFSNIIIYNRGIISCHSL